MTNRDREEQKDIAAAMSRGLKKRLIEAAEFVRKGDPYKDVLSEIDIRITVLWADWILRK